MQKTPEEIIERIEMRCARRDEFITVLRERNLHPDARHHNEVMRDAQVMAITELQWALNREQ